MTTLQELQALTDEQLIEKVAVEVMGWMKKEDEICAHCYGTGTRAFENQDERDLRLCIWCEGTKKWPTVNRQNWNPLTDWNHTMEVVKMFFCNSVGSLNHRLSISANDGFINVMLYTNSEDGMWESYGEFDDEMNPQRAICLATLLAVSS